ncbi:MAG: DUF1491 family protein [Pseudomonadota bacterium]
MIDGDPRLPAHVEVSSIIRMAEASGGMASVLARGERDAGTILLVMICRGMDPQLYERMPNPAGQRRFILTKSQSIEKKDEFSEYLARRHRQDPDIWIIEVDIDHPQRFVEELPV